MKNEKQRLGAWGEDLIATHYARSGYAIVARNVHCPFGEIDLVCSKRNLFYFIEVKTRTTLTFGYPEEAISEKKRTRLWRCAYWYLAEHRLGCTRAEVHLCAVYRDSTRDFIKIYTDIA